MMKKIVWLIAIAALLTLIMSTTAQAWTVTQVKTKTLSIAGDVTFESSFSAAKGETININIWPADPAVTINGVTLSKVTPKPKAGGGSIGVSGTGGHDVNVTLNNNRQRKSTFHLRLHLSTGERIGVNVRFGR